MDKIPEIDKAFKTASPSSEVLLMRLKELIAKVNEIVEAINSLEYDSYPRIPVPHRD